MIAAPLRVLYAFLIAAASGVLYETRSGSLGLGSIVIEVLEDTASAFGRVLGSFTCGDGSCYMSFWKQNHKRLCITYMCTYTLVYRYTYVYIYIYMNIQTCQSK